VDPRDIWLGPQLHLTAYDAAWTLTPKKVLLAAYARPHSRGPTDEIAGRKRKEKKRKDPSCWLVNDSCPSRVEIVSCAWLSPGIV
jgi:hypothetical protein